MLGFIFSLILLLAPTGQSYEPCRIYGKIYEESDPNLADYRVFIEDSEAFADVLVYEQQNPLYADRAGQWAFVENRSFANFYIYFADQRNRADFTIAFIDTESFAGCNR